MTKSLELSEAELWLILDGLEDKIEAVTEWAASEGAPTNEDQEYLDELIALRARIQAHVAPDRFPKQD